MTYFSDLLASGTATAPPPSAHKNGKTSEYVNPEWGTPACQHEDAATIDDASRLAFVTDPGSAGADRFRFLRMRLQELRVLLDVRSVLVTSPLPEDGKTTVVLNLATALAEGGKRSVLVVEGDLHHPSVAERLGLPLRAGLAECLEDCRDPRSGIRRVRPLDWFLLQAGKASVNPTELIQSNSFSAALKQLSTSFDWVLIDSPPVAPLTDAVWLSRQASTSLVVVRAGRTPRQVAQEAVELLGPKKVFGILFNGAERFNRLYSNYHKYYRKKRFYSRQPSAE
ncbi:MAG TPA: CpsD/CapB family tyrosine-protein kinase [Bryobacteraceae bacterium]|jgi:capsular exopolysaccharide synthesis family protein